MAPQSRSCVSSPLARLLEIGHEPGALDAHPLQLIAQRLDSLVGRHRHLHVRSTWLCPGCEPIGRAPCVFRRGAASGQNDCATLEDTEGGASHLQDYLVLWPHPLTRKPCLALRRSPRPHDPNIQAPRASSAAAHPSRCSAYTRARDRRLDAGDQELGCVTRLHCDGRGGAEKLRGSCSRSPRPRQFTAVQAASDYQTTLINAHASSMPSAALGNGFFANVAQTQPLATKAVLHSAGPLAVGKRGLAMSHKLAPRGAGRGMRLNLLAAGFMAASLSFDTA